MKTFLQIDGMSCAHCVQHVKEALESVEGVNSAEVDLAANSASVEHAENVSLNMLKTVVSEAGYLAT